MIDKDDYIELETATPEELLEAALWFYQDYEYTQGLRLGFKLARPGGWKHVAPHWLGMSKEIASKIEESE